MRPSCGAGGHRPNWCSLHKELQLQLLKEISTEMEMVLMAGANREFFSCFLGHISDLNFPERLQQKVALGRVVMAISSKFSLL
jgi:hypothetical protein